MAITKSWTDSWLAGSDPGSKIDDEVNEMSAAIHERMQNGGHSWEAGANSTDGIHKVSPNNYRPNEWNVFDSSNGVLLTVTDTDFMFTQNATFNGTLHSDGNVSTGGDLDVSGTLTANTIKESGNELVQKIDANRRMLAMTVAGTGNYGDTGEQIRQYRIILPVDATLYRFHLYCSITGYDMKVYYQDVTSWSSDTSCTLGTETLAATLTPGSQHLAREHLSPPVSLHEGAIIRPEPQKDSGYWSLTAFFYVEW